MVGSQNNNNNNIPPVLSCLLLVFNSPDEDGVDVDDDAVDWYSVLRVSVILIQR